MHPPLPAAAIPVTQAFLLYGQLRVRYDGRASSDLQTGNYLITYKQDGSLQVHGAALTPALNYQPAGSKLYRLPDQLVCRSRKEQLVVELDRVIFECQLPDWSAHKIVITRTERELRDKLAARLDQYLPQYQFDSIQLEYPTAHGPVDILALDRTGCAHIIEVKRAHATVSACVQLRKYVEAYAGQAIGYVAAPTIAAGALKYLRHRGFHYLPVQHGP